MTVTLALAEAKQQWFWELADSIALTLLLLNVLVLVAVHARRLRQYTRGRRTKRFRTRVGRILDAVDPSATPRDPHWLRKQISEFDELERPIAATMLIERMRPASEQERRFALTTLREAGAIDRIVRGTKAWMPWRRALAIRTLGWIGADETLPVLVERLSDRNRQVRETAVRALGRIGDATAVPNLAPLFAAPGRVGSGVVYDALVAMGPEGETVFADGLRSEVESVRVAACFGIAALAEPAAARSVLEPLLDDGAAPVRAAAAESLGQVGGRVVPPALARAAQDEQSAVRSAAVGALGSFDDPQSVEIALAALGDADRDTVVHAGETLVRLARREASAAAAEQAIERAATEWPVRRAIVYASLGAV
jgi:HEAT repeat protein